MPTHQQNKGWILETRGAAYVFGLNDAVLLTLRLRGLDLDGRYGVEGVDEIRSGAAWMNLDIPVRRIKQV
jgi:hypothetical protein